MTKKSILLIITLSTCFIINQTHAFNNNNPVNKLHGNPRDFIENLGNTPLTQAQEEIEKQFSIANEKVIKLKNKYNLAINQKNKNSDALRDCRIKQQKKQKIISKLCVFQQILQFCNNCSTQEINLYGHVKKKNDSDAHEPGGSFGQYIEAQRKYHTAAHEKEDFENQLLKCCTVHCHNDLLAKLEEWNKKN